MYPLFMNVLINQKLCPAGAPVS